MCKCLVDGCCAVCCFVAVHSDAHCFLLSALIEESVIRLALLFVYYETVTAVEKTLDHENICLYHKLGLHWRLVKRPVDGSRLTEYVLELQTLPKVQLMLPD
ncbi:hypothetical protein COOONC_04885 [Cooperia oncophora]